MYRANSSPSRTHAHIWCRTRRTETGMEPLRLHVPCVFKMITASLDAHLNVLRWSRWSLVPCPVWQSLTGPCGDLCGCWAFCVWLRCIIISPSLHPSDSLYFNGTQKQRCYRLNRRLNRRECFGLCVFMRPHKYLSTNPYIYGYR